MFFPVMLLFLAVQHSTTEELSRCAGPLLNSDVPFTPPLILGVKKITSGSVYKMIDRRFA